MTLNPDTSIDDKDLGGGAKKVLKLSASYYTATFYALMKTQKQKFKLKDNEQIDLLYRATFLYAMQIIFCAILYFYSGITVTYIRNTDVNVALFFTVLLLHLTCLPLARDGLAMMKYSLLHPEEFNHPASAFCLGIFSLTSIVAAELVNIANSQSKKTVADAIAGFIGFKCIIDLPSIYMNSYEEFPLKGAVGKLEVKRSRKSKEERPRMAYDLLFNIIYVIFNVLYKSVFFYFFPFATIVYPMVRSLKGNIGMDAIW